MEILGDAGLDFAIVDLEHGHFGLERATELLRACDAAGLAPLARARDVAGMGPLLDAGAVAVVVPGIEDAEAARAAVAAARYAPEGTRGACPCVRAGGHFIRDWRAHAAHAEAGVIALVETAAGIAEIECIAAVAGLLALMAGPFDLSVSMGLEGDLAVRGRAGGAHPPAGGGGGSRPAGDHARLRRGPGRGTPPGEGVDEARRARLRGGDRQDHAGHRGGVVGRFRRRSR